MEEKRNRTKKTRGLDPRGCRGCVYQSTSFKWCNYGDMEGRSRTVDGGPLQPDGGCKLFRKPESRKQLKQNRIPWNSPKGTPQAAAGQSEEEKSAIRQQQLQALYDLDLSDQKIADSLGINRKTVSRWRKDNRLESNYTLRVKQNRQGGGQA